jgi:hypothetical protein
MKSDGQVTLNRIREPEAPLPIPEVAQERFGKVTYETGERRTFIEPPLGCPAGFEYRVVNVELPIDAPTTCAFLPVSAIQIRACAKPEACNSWRLCAGLCPPQCSSTQASCDFSGPGRYAVSVVS